MDPREYFFNKLEPTKREELQKTRDNWFFWLCLVIAIGFVSTIISSIFDPVFRSVTPDISKTLTFFSTVVLIWGALFYFFAYYRFGTGWLTFHIWAGGIVYTIFYLSFIYSLATGYLTAPAPVDAVQTPLLLTLMHVVLSGFSVYFLVQSYHLRKVNRYVRALASGL